MLLSSDVVLVFVFESTSLFFNHHVPTQTSSSSFLSSHAGSHSQAALLPCYRFLATGDEFGRILGEKHSVLLATVHIARLRRRRPSNCTRQTVRVNRLKMTSSYM